MPHKEVAHATSRCIPQSATRYWARRESIEARTMQLRMFRRALQRWPKIYPCASDSPQDGAAKSTKRHASRDGTLRCCRHGGAGLATSHASLRVPRIDASPPLATERSKQKSPRHPQGGQASGQMGRHQPGSMQCVQLVACVHAMAASRAGQ